jgi:hypothetical protein
MKQITYLIAFAMVTFFHLAQVNAQATYGQDANGSPIKVSRYLEVNGSPYLFDTWQKGLVLLSNGQTYKLDIKYDLIADNLLFKNKDGDSLTFVLPVKEFKFTEAGVNPQTHIFRSGFPQTAANTGKESLYEVLYDGVPALLKKETKTIWEETTTYGTANRTKNINTKIVYYVFNGTDMKLLKNQKKAVLSAFPDKLEELDQYIKSNKLDVSKEVDLIKLFAHYASSK